MIEAEEAQRTALGALLDAHPGPLSRAELALELGDAIEADDATQALIRAGLANVAGELVFASRAAARSRELAV